MKTTNNMQFAIRAKAVLLFVFFVSFRFSGISQNIGISTTGATPNASALLDIDASPDNNRGLLVPRVTFLERTGVNFNPLPAAAQGLLVYQTNAGGEGQGYYYDTSATTTPSWVKLFSNTTGWSLTGNTGTVDGTNFIGTTDNIPFNIRVNNQKAGRIDPAGPTFLGYQAGNSNTNLFSTGIGYYALFNNTTGNDNTATGQSALFSNTTGSGNTATGVWALIYNTTGYENTANGASAMVYNTTGYRNIANGVYALQNNTTASQNIAIGYQSLYNQSFSNLGVAWNSDNVAVGYQALFSNQPTATNNGMGNTALGNNALYSNSTGIYNTACGLQAFYSNTTGTYNTANGVNALYSNTTGSFNTAIGFEALYSNTTGSNNTAVGYGVGLSAGTFTNATAIGANAIAGASNSLVLGGTGANAVRVGIGTTTPVAFLEVFGASSENIRSTRNTGTVVGQYVGGYAFGGYNSVSSIVDYAIISANANGNTPGSENGDLHFYTNTNGVLSQKMWIGANGRVGIGNLSPGAMLHIDAGVSNEVLRLEGDGLTFLSFHESANRRAYLQYNTTPNVYSLVAEEAGSQLVLSTSNSERIRIDANGNVGIGTVTPGGQFELSLDQGRKPSTNTWTIVSDARLKNIEGDYTKGLKEILQLQPITYRYKNVGDRVFKKEVLNTLNVGFSAQDVQKIFPEAVGTDDDEYLNFNMHSILVAYVNAIKEQQQMIDSLKTENATLKAASDKQQTTNTELKADLSRVNREIEKIKQYLELKAGK